MDLKRKSLGKSVQAKNQKFQLQLNYRLLKKLKLRRKLMLRLHLAPKLVQRKRRRIDERDRQKLSMKKKSLK
jgi:hypothetical protein